MGLHSWRENRRKERLRKHIERKRGPNEFRTRPDRAYRVDAKGHPLAWSSEQELQELVRSPEHQNPIYDFFDSAFLGTAFSRGDFAIKCKVHIHVRSKTVPSLEDLLKEIKNSHPDGEVFLYLRDCVVQSLRLDFAFLEMSICLVNCCIIGMPHIHMCTIKGSLGFVSCYIPRISLIGINISGTLALTGCTITSICLFTNVQSSSTINFAETLFANHLSMNGVAADRGVSMTSVSVIGGFDFKCDGRDFDVRSLAILDCPAKDHLDEIDKRLFKVFSSWKHVSWKFPDEEPRPLDREFEGFRRPSSVWSFIRSVHETPVLTRISVISLLVIPILAAIWNAADQAVDMNLFLPLSLSLTFVSSLLYFVGYSLFKTLCPSIVFDFSRSEFSAERVASVTRERGACTAEMRRSVLALSRDARYRCMPSSKFISYHAETVWVPDLSRVSCFTGDLPARSQVAPGDLGEDRFILAAEDRRRIVAEVGGYCEYDSEACKLWHVGILVAFLYIVAVLLLLAVAILQVVAVLRASGIFL